VSDYYASVEPERLRRERARARALRASQWWKRRIEAGICHYCRRRVGARALTMDHIVPLGRGGRSVRGNVVPACKDCNTRKRSLVPVEWREYLDSLAREE
jgi:5-methylcytosine-specific restriction endonuclease McrA